MFSFFSYLVEVTVYSWQLILQDLNLMVPTLGSRIKLNNNKLNGQYTDIFTKIINIHQMKDSIPVQENSIDLICLYTWTFVSFYLFLYLVMLLQTFYLKDIV